MQTRSQAESSGIKLLKVHSVGKGSNTSVQPEKTSHKTHDFKSKGSFANKTKVMTRENRNKIQNENSNF